MFTSHAVKALQDLSYNISDPLDWQAGLLRTIRYHLNITAIATEPTSGLFALGTSTGSIHLCGSPGVEYELKINDPPGLRVKFLHFAASVFKLLSIDEHNRLHVWDLTSAGGPKLQRITGLGQPVNALATSPSHSHAFIALASGEVKTYDLLCLRISQYLVPNLWKIHEEMSLDMGERPALDVIVDVVIHPRDLNLLFVAYAGGVTLLDLKEQKAVRTFELTLAPGAPGGSGYYTKDILLSRHLQVTALAIHPSGHLLSVGYIDGTIGFWTLEDEDKPLLLRTIDSAEGEDLSIVDTVKLESAMSSAQQDTPDPPREPIFKLSWSGLSNSSDPRGGDTVLTVLGGITLDSPPCVTTLLLPPLQPPAPPSPTSPKGQPVAATAFPEVRAAICASLSVKNVHSYNAAGIVQDFLLFPRNSPHFSGTYDPCTILIVSESNAPEARICEAFEFPPPAFVKSPLTPVEATDPTALPQEEHMLDPDAALVEELARTLQSMSESDDPRPARLPQCLWTVLEEYPVRVDKHAYETLVRDKLELIDGEVPFPIKGGKAWAADPEGLMKYTKKQPHRILIAQLRDLSVRFLDISAQLLNSVGPDNPLATSYPSPIPRLTIELTPILLDPSLGLTDTTVYDPHLSKHHIDTVHFAPESLECVTVLRSGAVILHRLDVPASATTLEKQTLPDKELVSLSHLRVRKGLRYSPFFAIKPDTARGKVSSCALSDVGFLAVAYSFGLLLVVDLRIPKIILRSDTRPGGSSFLHSHSEFEPIQALAWTCCGLSTNPQVRMRLFCTTPSGQTSIYTLEYAVPSTWQISLNPVTVDGSAQPVPEASFVLDASKGTRCIADRNELASVLKPGEGSSTDGLYIWVSVGAKGARCMLNVNGERIAKVDWGHKVGIVQRAEVVRRLDSLALVVFTTHGLGLVYSLPHLEHIHTLQLDPEGFSDPPATDDSGDYLTHTRFPVPSGSSFRPIHSTELHTLFITRRAGPYAPPLVDLAHGRSPVPPQPQPVSLGPASIMSSVLGYLGSLSVTSAGDQIDALLAGPDRPVPPPPTKAAPSPSSAKNPEAPSSAQSSVSANAAGMSSAVGGIYSRLGNALAERGEMLGDLQQSMNSLEEGSKNMVAQAKRLAAQQTAKGWFGF